jgi:hypothetical protein
MEKEWKRARGGLRNSEEEERTQVSMRKKKDSMEQV